jgi:hypothetical protein
MNKLKWKLFCCMRDYVTKCDGVIFGGYVRDMIIHDHYSRTYYKAIKNNDDYNNSNIHPESWPMRTIVPERMDIVMTADNFKNLMDTLEQNSYEFKIKTKKDYDVLFVTIKMHPLLTSIIVPTIKIHIFKTLPEKIDFECNSLIIQNGTITMQNILNPFCKYKKVNAIVDDIVNFIAVPIEPDTFNMFKIIEKNFKVLHIIDSKEPCSRAKKCVICSVEFMKEPIIKNTCCDAQYHIQCYKETCLRALSEHNNVHYCSMCKGAHAYIMQKYIIKTSD